MSGEWVLSHDCWVLQGQQAAKSGIDAAHGQAKAGADQAADTAASQVGTALCSVPSHCCCDDLIAWHIAASTIGRQQRGSMSASLGWRKCLQYRNAPGY